MINMELFTINIIKKDSNLYNYLREDSSWYKELNRNRNALKELTKAMKEKYKLTTSDKIENLSRNINLLSTFIDVLK